MTNNDTLIAVYEQYCLHARHQELQRLTFTSIYGVLVAGTLAFIGSVSIPTARIGAIVGLLIISLLGFHLCHIWRIPFLWFSRIPEQMLIEDFKLGKYRRFYSEDKEEFKIKLLSGSTLFHFFYIFMESFFSFLLVVVLREDLVGITIGIVASIIVVFILSLVYCFVFRKREEMVKDEINRRFDKFK